LFAGILASIWDSGAVVTTGISILRAAWAGSRRRLS